MRALPCSRIGGARSAGATATPVAGCSGGGHGIDAVCCSSHLRSSSSSLGGGGSMIATSPAASPSATPGVGRRSGGLGTCRLHSAASRCGDGPAPAAPAEAAARLYRASTSRQPCMCMSMCNSRTSSCNISSSGPSTSAMNSSSGLLLHRGRGRRSVAARATGGGGADGPGSPGDGVDDSGGDGGSSAESGQGKAGGEGEDVMGRGDGQQQPREGGDKPDIDALAAFLSQEAVKLRASMDSMDSADPVDESAAFRAQGVELFLPQAPQADFEAVLFDAVGDGGLDASDFELVQQLGSIMVQQSLPGGLSRPTTTVVAYAARLHQLGERPVVTMLKEYLPVARPVALNEMLLLLHLCGPMRMDKHAAASAPPDPSSPPVVPLLGYFTSAPSEEAAIASSDTEIDSVWLAYKWEGLRPLGLLMEAGPPPAAYGLFKSSEDAEAEAWDGRRALLRSIAKGLMKALDFCHSADVVHGSLSSGSVLLGPWEQFRPGGARSDVDVRLDSFGFGKWYTGAKSDGASDSVLFGPQADSAALAAGKREDLQAAGLLLAEALVRCMAPGLEQGLLPPGEAPTAPAGTLDRAGLQRLLFGVFVEDIVLFREYCCEDLNKYQLLVDFMDEDSGAGWELLGLLLHGEMSALQLMQHRFFSQRVSSRVAARKDTDTSKIPGMLGGLKLPWQK